MRPLRVTVNQPYPGPSSLPPCRTSSACACSCVFVSPGCKWRPAVCPGSAAGPGFCLWIESTGGAGWLGTGWLALTADPGTAEHWHVTNTHTNTHQQQQRGKEIHSVGDNCLGLTEASTMNKLQLIPEIGRFTVMFTAQHHFILWSACVCFVCVWTWKWWSTDRKYSCSGSGPLKFFLKSLTPSLEKCRSNLWTNSFTTNQMSSKLSLWIR